MKRKSTVLVDQETDDEDEEEPPGEKKQKTSLPVGNTNRGIKQQEKVKRSTPLPKPPIVQSVAKSYNQMMVDNRREALSFLGKRKEKSPVPPEQRERLAVLELIRKRRALDDKSVDKG